MKRNFSGDKRRLLELAGLTMADMSKILTEEKCDKCNADPCKCKKEQEEIKAKSGAWEETKVCKNCKCRPCKCVKGCNCSKEEQEEAIARSSKEEQEEVKECSCGCDPSKCKCPADCKCGCNKKD